MFSQAQILGVAASQGVRVTPILVGEFIVRVLYKVWQGKTLLVAVLETIKEMSISGSSQ